MEDQNKESLQSAVEQRAEEFKEKKITGPIRLLQYWLYGRKVIRMKLQDMWAADMDVTFFKSTMKSELEYDDTLDRTIMSEEKKKPINEQDLIKIEECEDRIARAKAIKQQYRRTLSLRDEIKQYIELMQNGK